MRLRRQLDGFAQGTPIGEIVDSCRVWESHSDSNRIAEAIWRLEEVLARLSDFGLQLKAKNIHADGSGISWSHSGSYGPGM